VLYAYRAHNRKSVQPQVEIIPPQPRPVERRREIQEGESGREPERRVV